MNPTPMNQQFPVDIDVEHEYGYDEDFVEQPSDDYKCPICLLACKQAVQTECGHRFCDKCIIKVITESDRANCPMDNVELDEDQVFPDNSVRKEILRLNVRCRKKGEGCEWVGGLGQLNDHLDSDCNFTWKDCTAKCGEKMLRKDIDDHLENHCQRRIVDCKYCGIKIVFKMLDEHVGFCDKKLTDCPNACGRLERGKLSQHLESFCPKSLLVCQFWEFGCIYECLREAMNEHITQEQESHFGMMSDVIKKLKLTCERLDFELKQSQWESKCLKLKTQLSELEQTITSLQTEEIAALKEQVQTLMVKCERNQMDITEIRSKMHNGCLFWKIGNYEQLFQEAKDGTKIAINSLEFYTGVPGYKMYVRLNLNGVDDGTGSHVSIFLHMMQGDFDDVIEWPFLGTIVLTVVDQCNNQQHLVEKLVGKPSITAFQRPTLGRNSKGYGYARMFPHTDHTKRGFLKDDCLLIKIQVQSSE